MSLINRRSLMMNMEDNELEEFRVLTHILPNEDAKTSAQIRIGINCENVHEAIIQPVGGVPSSGYRKYDVGVRRIGQNKWAATISRSSVNTLLNFANVYGEDKETVTDMAKNIVVNYLANAGVGTTIRIYGK